MFILYFKSNSNLSINPGIRADLPPIMIFEQISARTISSMFSTASRIVSTIPFSFFGNSSPIHYCKLYYAIYYIMLYYVMIHYIMLHYIMIYCIL